MLFISNRDIVVRSSKAAQAIRFVKNEPQEVPKSMFDEVMAIGILPVEGEQESAQNVIQKADPNKPKLAPDDGAARAEQILAVVEAIVAKNNAKDFTGGAAPSAASVTAALGWKTDQKEVSDVWKKNRERILTAKREADAGAGN